MTYDNSNTGLLARNDRKEKDSHPDFKGSINVDGVEYWLSAWTKEGRDGTKLAGKKYFSLSVTPKEEQAKPAPKAKQSMADMDDDIPFANAARGRAWSVV